MLKNKKISIYLILLCIVVIGLTYWYFPFKPKSFYSESTIKKMISETFEGEFAVEIQDIQFIDKTHVFVPYISKEKEYGISLWKWEHHDWKVVNISDRGGLPFVWKINPINPSSYVIFWNYHPNDHVNTLKFHLVQKRSFYSSEEISFYTPLINLEKKINVQNKTYGFLKYPAEWSKLLNIEKKVGAQETSLLFNQANYNTAFYISWRAYLKNGKEAFPENSVNGNSFSTGDELFDSISIESDDQIQ